MSMIQIQIQADSVVLDMNRFINFWLQSLATRGERQFLKAYAKHTMLPPPQCTVHFVVFKISAGRDPKNSTACLNGRKLNYSFQNPQILRTISSEHDIIHTLAPFPAWWFIMTYDDCCSLSARV